MGIAVITQGAADICEDAGQKAGSRKSCNGGQDCNHCRNASDVPVAGTTACESDALKRTHNEMDGKNNRLDSPLYIFVGPGLRIGTADGGGGAGAFSGSRLIFGGLRGGGGLAQKSDIAGIMGPLLADGKSTADKSAADVWAAFWNLGLAAVAKAVSEDWSRQKLGPQIDMAVVLAAFLFACQPLLQLLEDISEAVLQCRTFIGSFVPVFAAVMVSCGQPAASAVYTGFFLSGVVLAASLITGILIPFLKIYMALTVAGGVSTTADLGGVASLISRFIKWGLGLIANCFWCSGRAAEFACQRNRQCGAQSGKVFGRQ